MLAAEVALNLQSADSGGSLRYTDRQKHDRPFLNASKKEIITHSLTGDRLKNRARNIYTTLQIFHRCDRLLNFLLFCIAAQIQIIRNSSITPLAVRILVLIKNRLFEQNIRCIVALGRYLNSKRINSKAKPFVYSEANTET